MERFKRYLFPHHNGFTSPNSLFSIKMISATNLQRKLVGELVKGGGRGIEKKKIKFKGGAKDIFSRGDLNLGGSWDP